MLSLLILPCLCILALLCHLLGPTNLNTYFMGPPTPKLSGGEAVKQNKRNFQNAKVLNYQTHEIVL